MQHIFSKITKSALVALCISLTFNVSAAIVKGVEVTVTNPDASTQTLNFDIDTDAKTATLIEKQSGHQNYSGDIYVPAEISPADYSEESFVVTAIEENAFANRNYSSSTTVRSITLPYTIDTIHHAAFRYCAGIVSFSIDETGGESANFMTNDKGLLLTKDGTKLIAYPSGNTSVSFDVATYGITNLDRHAFTDAVNLQEVNVRDITELPEGCFARCANLTDIITTSETGITILGKSALKGTALETFDLSNITSLSGEMFMGCTNLTSVIIPKSLTSIPDKCFSGCTSLGSVVFEQPSSLTTIGTDAFRNTAITTIFIPKSVNRINNGAFFDCNSLVEVNVYNPLPPTIGSANYAVFGTKPGGSSIRSTASLNVPCGKESDYTASWSKEFTAEQISATLVAYEIYPSYDSFFEGYVNVGSTKPRICSDNMEWTGFASVLEGNSDIVFTGWSGDDLNNDNVEYSNEAGTLTATNIENDIFVTANFAKYFNVYYIYQDNDHDGSVDINDAEEGGSLLSGSELPTTIPNLDECYNLGTMTYKVVDTSSPMALTLSDYNGGTMPLSDLYVYATISKKTYTLSVYYNETLVANPSVECQTPLSTVLNDYLPANYYDLYQYDVYVQYDFTGSAWQTAEGEPIDRIMPNSNYSVYLFSETERTYPIQFHVNDGTPPTDYSKFVYVGYTESISSNEPQATELFAEIGGSYSLPECKTLEWQYGGKPATIREQVEAIRADGEDNKKGRIDALMTTPVQATSMIDANPIDASYVIRYIARFPNAIEVSGDEVSQGVVYEHEPVLRNTAIPTGITPAVPSAPGGNCWTFKGWDESVLKRYNGLMPCNDINIYGDFEISKFTLTFLNQDGTTLDVISDVEFGSDLVGYTAGLQPIMNLGYAFADWDFSENTTMPCNNLSVIPLSREVGTNTISFKIVTENADGSINFEDAEDFGTSLEITTGSTLSSLTVSGYELPNADGSDVCHTYSTSWKTLSATSAGLADYSDMVITNDLTLYCLKTDVKFSITYVPYIDGSIRISAVTDGTTILRYSCGATIDFPEYFTLPTSGCYNATNEWKYIENAPGVDIANVEDAEWQSFTGNQMPSFDIYVMPIIELNHYNVYYKKDGVSDGSLQVDCGKTVTYKPIEDGFSDWKLENGDAVPANMPNHDITVVSNSLHNITYTLNIVKEGTTTTLTTVSLEGQNNVEYSADIDFPSDDEIIDALNEYDVKCFNLQTASEWLASDGNTYTTVPNTLGQIVSFTKTIEKHFYQIDFEAVDGLSYTTTAKTVECGGAIELPAVSIADNCFENPNGADADWSWEYRLANSATSAVPSWDDAQSLGASWPDGVYENIVARPIAQRRSIELKFQIDGKDYTPGRPISFNCGEDIDETLLPNLNELAECEDCYTAWTGKPADGKMADNVTLSAKSIHKVTFTLKEQVVYKGDNQEPTSLGEPIVETLMYGVNIPFKSLSDFEVDNTNNCYNAGSWLTDDGSQITTVPTNYEGTLNKPAEIALTQTLSISAYDVVFKADGTEVKKIDKQNCGTVITLSDGILPSTDVLNRYLTDDCKTFAEQTWSVDNQTVTEDTKITIANTDVEVSISSATKQGKLLFLVDTGEKNENGSIAWTTDDALTADVACGTLIADYIKENPRSTTLTPATCHEFADNWTWEDGSALPEDESVAEGKMQGDEYKVYLFSALQPSTIIYMVEGFEEPHATRAGNCGDNIPADVPNPNPADYGKPTEHFVGWNGLSGLTSMPAGELTVYAQFEPNDNAEVRYHTISIDRDGNEAEDQIITESKQIGSMFDIKDVPTEETGCYQYSGWKLEKSQDADNITAKQLQMPDEDGLDLYLYKIAHPFVVRYSPSQNGEINVTPRSKRLYCGDAIILSQDEYNITDNCYNDATLSWQYQVSGSEDWKSLDAAATMNKDFDGITVRPAIEKYKLDISFVTIDGVTLSGETTLKDVECGSPITTPSVVPQDCYEPAGNAADWEWEYIYATSNDWAEAKPLPLTLSSDIRSAIQARPKVADKLFTITYQSTDGKTAITITDNTKTQYKCNEKIDFPQSAAFGCYALVNNEWEYYLADEDKWVSFTNMPAFDITARPKFETRTGKVEFYVDDKLSDTQEPECGTLIKDIKAPLDGHTAWLNDNGEELGEQQIAQYNYSETIKLYAYSLHTVTFTLNINEIYNGQSSPIESNQITLDDVPFGTDISELTPSRDDFDGLTDVDLSDECYSAMSDFLTSQGDEILTVGGQDLELVSNININAYDVLFYGKKKGIKTNPILYTATRVRCGTPMSAELFDADKAEGEPEEYAGEHIDESNPWVFDNAIMSNGQINAYPNYISNEDVDIAYVLVENNVESAFTPVNNPTERAGGLSISATELTDKVADADKCKNYSSWLVKTTDGEYVEFETIIVKEGLTFYMLVTDKEPAVVTYKVGQTVLEDVTNVPCGKALSDYLKPIADLGEPENCKEYPEEWTLTLEGKSIAKDYVVQSGDRIIASVEQKQVSYVVTFDVSAIESVTITLPTIEPVTVVCDGKITEPDVYAFFEAYPQSEQYYVEYLDAQGNEFDFSQTKITENTTIDVVVRNDWPLVVTVTNPVTNLTQTTEYMIVYGQPFGDKLQGYEVAEYGMSWLFISDNQYGPVTITDFDHMPADYILAVAIYDKPTIESVTVCESDEEKYPYCWNGLYFDKPGTFPYYDSQNMHLSILELTVLKNDTFEITASRCGSMIWEGEELTKSGDYSHIYTSKLTGCDSVVVLHLTINPILYGDTAAIVCDNKFEWHGKTFYKDEAYSEDELQITLKSVITGCDSIVTLNLTFSDDLPMRDSVITTCTVNGLDEEGNIIQVFNYTKHDGTIEQIRRTDFDAQSERLDNVIVDIAPAKDAESCDTIINVTVILTSDGFVHKAVPNYIFPADQKQMGTLKTWQEPTCGNGNVWIVEAQETNPNYHFTQWDDSTTTNPRRLIVISDTVIVANFVEAKPVSELHNITFGTMNSNLGEVEAWIDLTAIPFEDRYRFDHWDANGVWYESTDETISIDLNRPENQRSISIMAYFADTYEPYKPQDNGGDNSGRGGDVQPRNPNNTIFVPNGHNPTILLGTQNDIQDGLDETPIEGTVFVGDRTITVVGHQGFDMQVYSVVGLLIYDGKIVSQTTVVNVPAHNVYLVKIGTQIAKVVVK